MSRRENVPSTPALRLLRDRGVEHRVHTYRYVERGGAAASSEALGRELHGIAKTLVFEDDRGEPLLIVMHGDLEVSEKALARELGVRSVRPCAVATAERHTGYRVGGTSPFGTRRTLPVLVERTLLDLPTILVNAGARGVLVELDPSVLVELLDARAIQVART